MHHAAVEILLLLLVGCVVGVGARRLRLPYTLALVVAGIALGFVDPQELHAFELNADLLFTFLLPALLFEAALHLDVADLRRNAVPIGLLALPGVLIATAVTAGVTWIGIDALGRHPNFGYGEALLFGSVIAATDPISVLALFRELGVPRRLYLLVEGESLLNDGVAVVVFLIVAAALGVEVGHGGHVEVHGANEILIYGVRTFLWMVGGGVLCGAVLGGLAGTAMRQFDDHLVEVTITTIVAYGSFLLAEEIGASGVLSTVTAGMVTGSFATRYGMSTRTRLAVEDFWEYAAFIGNTLVFLLLGVELRIAPLMGDMLPILIAFGATLLGRAVAVYGSAPLARFGADPVPKEWSHVMWWGGLRGSLSIVLVLGLPLDFAARDTLLHMVFGVVAASLFLQGLTVPVLMRRLGVGVRSDDRSKQADRHRARLVAVQQALHALDAMRHEGVVALGVHERLRAWYGDRKNEAAGALSELLGEADEVRASETIAVLLHLHDVEREAVRHAGRADVVDAAAVTAELAELDERVATLKHALHGGHDLSDTVDGVLR
ncbi:MAG: CPA1 family monovalent cation:H+ antiporter [Myxococcota bacterium]|jgi:CPA1 family monovalent cation:H+ antiporter